MAVIETRRSDIRELEGVHLFHFATSNCSQRVRFALEEKGVSWKSQHVDLTKNENATPEFTALNPNGVVPVLIHDGVTIVESNDIIRYVDECFEGASLHPKGEADRLYFEHALARSSQFQAPLKLLMHEFLFKPFRRMNESQLADYVRGTESRDLIDFMTEFSSAKGFSAERIDEALQVAEGTLSDIETRLESSDWLNGAQFGLADISWVVNVHRFEYMGYPMDRYPGVCNWLTRVLGRPAFGRAIRDYESRKMKVIFGAYTLIRKLKGSSVGHFLER